MFTINSKSKSELRVLNSNFVRVRAHPVKSKDQLEKLFIKALGLGQPVFICSIVKIYNILFWVVGVRVIYIYIYK